MVGGYTRLMHAGLSIVDWKPITGVIPPLSAKAWMLEFEKYKLFPEFKDINFNMSLHEFKTIYFIEYSHRLLGRVLGLVFIIPFIWFSITKQLTTSLFRRCLFMLFIGGCQGLMGWYMVKSGLVKDPAVSHFRLAAHLLLAFLVMGMALWNILDLQKWQRQSALTPWFILALLVTTITYGAFTAGLKAGLIYNTFPMMGDHWIAAEWNFMTPLWLNFIENHATVQFMHRLLAIVTCIIVALYWWKNQNRLSFALLMVTLIQVCIGILTLVMHVPVILGVLHQGWGVVVFAHALMLCYGNKSSLHDN